MYIDWKKFSQEVKKTLKAQIFQPSHLHTPTTVEFYYFSFLTQRWTPKIIHEKLSFVQNYLTLQNNLNYAKFKEKNV